MSGSSSEVALPQEDVRASIVAWWWLERTAAMAVAFLLAFRLRLPPDVPIGFLAAGALLPVTIAVVRRNRGVLILVTLAVLATGSGLFLTWVADTYGQADTSLTIVQTARVLGLAIGVLALLWARTVVGTRMTILLYGAGALSSAAVFGVNLDNPWKFSLSVPVALIVLSSPLVYGNKRNEILALVALGAVSALNDSRSAAAMFLIGAAVLATRSRSARSAARSVGPVLLQLTLLGAGGFYLVQAAVVEGMLGEGARSRTLEQIDRSGSVLVGGRPEIGASWALLTERPLGYGAGALPSPSDVNLAKSGMMKLGYDPNNGYVENYMFGYGFEVHSLLGDLWILFGLAGCALAVVVLVLTSAGLLRGIAQGTATAVLVFLALRTAWDFAFSPFPSAMETVMLAVAVAVAVAVPHVRASHGGDEVPDGGLQPEVGSPSGYASQK